ncbi:replication factor C small subunit [Candidatus Woesearchaeota archaeon]|nr:replication factor C small subunit [Candidatus Woesearchaeota archaeon]
MTDSAIWTEKYRPKAFKDVHGQHDVVKRVEAFVRKKNMPHLLFSGPPGVGKTTLSLVICRELFGEHWRQNLLELNASDERGIDVVRNTVKDFARTKAIGNVPWKIIYLDECDALTKDAQHALRRTMETYTQTARFILSCNYSSKIIDPIQSRCAVFRFKPLPKEAMMDIVQKLADAEKLTLAAGAADALITIAEGDCRKLENTLQSCAVLEKTVTPELIFSLASVAEPAELKAVLEKAVAGQFTVAKNQLIDVMTKYGLSGMDAVRQLQKEVWNLPLTDRQKVTLVEACGEAEFRMVEGSDEVIQLSALLAKALLVGQK